ncbi:MAG TPA: tetratricopeptide repeat protein [bacterium]|nr:tetratricopeptide repeat protein [bacterium]HPO09468.1 tetratricopeptide repeat protein [bacterium]HQP99786.1 tetratricopeptide repeat protein [bacterium]
MDIDDYTERAHAAIRQGELDLAEQYFNLILQYAPDHPAGVEGLKEIQVARARRRWSRPVRFLVGMWCRVLMGFGRYDRAMDLVELLYRCEPQRFSMAASYAVCCDNLGRTTEALEAYRAVLALRPRQVPFLRRAAELAAQEDHLDESIGYLRRLASMFPDDEQVEHRIRDLLAREYAQTGIPEKLTERRATMEKKLREMPGSPEFTRRLEQLEEECEKDPDAVQPRLRLITHLREAGLFQRANKALAPMIDANPKDFQVRLEQARLWQAENELLLASNLFGELLAEQPKEKSVQEEYWDCRAAYLKQENQDHPDDKSLKTQIQHAQQQRNSLRSARLENQIREHPEDFDSRLDLGNLLYETGHYEEAVSVLQRLLREPPYAGRAHLILGNCFRKHVQMEIAAQEFRTAIELFKNRGYSHVPGDDLKEAYYSLGLCLEEMGDRHAAREAYAQIYAADIHFRDIRERYERLSLA